MRRLYLADNALHIAKYTPKNQQFITFGVCYTYIDPLRHIEVRFCLDSDST